MPDKTEEGSYPELQALLEQQLARTAVLEKQVKKINTYIRWQWIFITLKIIVIAVPIVLGIIYLPPLLQDVLSPYQELLGNVQQLNTTAGKLNSAEGNLDINALLNGFSR